MESKNIGKLRLASWEVHILLVFEKKIGKASKHEDP